jgi:HSF-type DNA-binding
MEMLDDPQNVEMMAWLPHGRAFAIYRKREFASEVLPKYFLKAAKYSSFTRKLNRWGFVRVTRGPETGAYYHRLFRRNERRLVLQMTCHTTSTSSGTNSSAHSVAGPSTVSASSKRYDNNPHAAMGNDSASMMMYQQHHGDQYFYYQNPYAGPQHHQNPSLYPDMSQQHHYHGNMSPYTVGDPSQMDGMGVPSHPPSGGHYYQPPMGNMHPNQYTAPQQHAPFLDPYMAHATYGTSDVNISMYGDTMASQTYSDDNMAKAHVMPPMSERVVPPTTKSTARTDEMRMQKYCDDECKDNCHRIGNGASSFHAMGRQGFEHHNSYSSSPPPYGMVDTTTPGNNTMSQHPHNYNINYGGSEHESEMIRQEQYERTLINHHHHQSHEN